MSEYDFLIEPFEFDYELEEEWETPPLNRSSQDYIRWVQQSLNQLLGLNLSTDGIIGTQTRSAIRSFQQQQGLTADGVVGARTEAAIKAALGVAPTPAASASLSATPSVATSGCNKAKRLTVGTTPVWGVPGDTGFFFKTGMSIDADGAPQAYHPHGKGLDYLGNAGHPGNWWGVVTDTRKPSGTPISQAPGDPAPGYYVSTTSLMDSQYAATDPRRYVDATQIPYIALPGGKPARYAQLGAHLGDFAAVINTRNNRVTYAIFADVGPARHIGEGSIALAQALGHNPFKSNGKAAIGIGSGIIYVVFPNSGNGQPRSVSTINAEGARLFNNWGGLVRATACLP